MKSINTLRFSLLALSLITHQATAAVVNIAGTAQNYEELGYAVATGDFDCDGYDDLVMGAPGESGEGMNVGAINIVYGGTGSGGQIGTANNQQLPEGAYLRVQPGDDFGGVLAAGDYNGDGCHDMVIGIPGAPTDYVSNISTGSVQLVYGDIGGLRYEGSHNINQNLANVDGVNEWNDYFGKALASGDFNADGRADLAVGAPGDINGGIEGGAVQVFYGAPGALNPANDQLFVQ